MLGLVATGWQNAPERPLALPASPGWLVAHIVVALAAYGFLTLAAVAGAGTGTTSVVPAEAWAQVAPYLNNSIKVNPVSE